MPPSGPKIRHREVDDACDLLARHRLVALAANLAEPGLQHSGELVAPLLALVLEHERAFLIAGKGKEDVPGARVDEADARAHPDRHVPVARAIDLGDDDEDVAVVDDKMHACSASRAKRLQHRQLPG